jgi:hypothetical protein
MINEVIRGISKGKIKVDKINVIAFGLYEYPKTIKQMWKQFKMELWLKK